MRVQFDQLIGYWIKRIYRDMTNLHDRKLFQYGLTTAQVGVLALLWETDGLSQKDIHEKLGIRPASLSNLLDGLVANGWVVRREDPEDARVKRVFLTEEGKALEDVCLNILMEMEGILQKGFAPEELSLLLAWLKRVHQNLE